MFDLKRMFHVGLSVADIQSAREKMGADLNLEWSVIGTFDPLPFWTPEAGNHEVSVLACYSKPGPQHLELVQGTGAFYDPNALPDSRHIGVWVDDLPMEAEKLLSAGWRVLAAGAAPDDGFGTISYMAPPIPGLVVELVSTELESAIAEWLSASE